MIICYETNSLAQFLIFFKKISFIFYCASKIVISALYHSLMLSNSLIKYLATFENIKWNIES